MQLVQDDLRTTTRRYFFKQCGTGIGALALASLLNEKLFASARELTTTNPMAPKLPHFSPKAKSIIYLFMAGGPTQIDLFDFKPTLNKYNGKPIPEEILKGDRFAFIKGIPNLLGSPYKFSKYGKSGAEVSELLPSLTEVVDDIAIIKSMSTDAFNHAPAQIFVNTGSTQLGRPSMGSWLTYGLGTESQDLPGFVVLISGAGQPDAGYSCWSSGFLPTVYQGVQFRSQGDPVLFLSNPSGMTSKTRRRSLDALRQLNEIHFDDIKDPEISTRISSFEMAYRMQTSAPELMEISKEPESIHKMYGTEPGKVSFANNCLLARRLVERGVRFVQLYHHGWDTHGHSKENDIIHKLPEMCRQTEHAAAALIKDLKQRGLLESTLVIWGGEFGRTPMNEGYEGSKFLGRDHHPRAFSVWTAGGGSKSGITLGSTDDIGYNIVEDKVHVHDLQATILHLMGLDHTQLTYKFQGRLFRLTDVSGNVMKKLLA